MSHLLHSRTRYAALTVALVLALGACRSTAPPGVSPAAATAFTQTRVIKALDLVRDAAISANEQPAMDCNELAVCPPILSTETTRRIVQYHRSAISLVHSSASGWTASVLVGLDEAVRNLPPSERRYLEPYAALIRSIVEEVIR